MDMKTIVNKIDRMEKRLQRLENGGGRSRTSLVDKVLRRSEESRQQRKARILAKTGGALKDKLPKDSVAWQRGVRAEWDARFKRETS